MFQSDSTSARAYLNNIYSQCISLICIYVRQKLRARLVPHLRLMTIGMNRVLMKEGDFPLFVYFVVSGEIEMSRRIYHKVSDKSQGICLSHLFTPCLQLAS